MRARKKSPYGGKLATPLPRRPIDPYGLGWWHSEHVDVFAADDAWWQEYLERVVLLMQHYGIDPQDSDRWSFLALALARDWVPGFQHEGGRGRRRTREHPVAYSARAALLQAFEAHGKSSHQHSDTTFCTRLVKQRPQELPQYYRDKAKLTVPALLKDLSDARKERDRAAKLHVEWEKMERARLQAFESGARTGGNAPPGDTQAALVRPALPGKPSRK
jgi:hypothetical protein